MVDPVPPYLSPEQLKHLQRLTDASRLRASLYPSPRPSGAARGNTPVAGRTRGAPRACADATSGE
ncbi:hypothetical protein ABTX62_23045 [Streptomyces sp. NPDC096046]|uniref:hypothetical protein n=1 Tax=Streptomyces sp. NPDC096046 TaxID=3155542 RepID=UPI003332C055